MDHYGIGQAIYAACLIYFRSARGTGRTESLIKSVKDGDCICFSDSKEAKRVERLCKERGVKVSCIVDDPKYPSRVLKYRSTSGRMLFDHTWIEKYYLLAIENAQKEIDGLQQMTSAHGTDHEETVWNPDVVNRWMV